MDRSGSRDRSRLADHRDLIRDLENRLGGLSAAECAPVEVGTLTDWPQPAWYGDRADAFFRLITAAFSCDLTRVATMVLTQPETASFGGPSELDAHEYAHNAPTDATAEQVMTDYHSYHAGQFAQLVEMLRSVEEGSGTLLDNTLVVWCGELTTGDHSFVNMPIVIAGNGGGALARDRYVRWAPTEPTTHRGYGSWDGLSAFSGPAHNKLLHSLAQTMGLELNQIGESSMSGFNGESVDLTGVLDRIWV